MQPTRLFSSSVLFQATTQAQRGMLASRRLFSCQPALRGQEPTDNVAGTEAAENPASEETAEAEAEPQEPIKLSRRRRRFHEWVKGSGARFVRPADGTTNFIGDTPFPNNPLFQPRPPLSDARRQEIYDAYMADPENETIRKLATKFGISMRRVEAVLKLKELEKEFEMNGAPLQTQFTKGMEKLMGVNQGINPLQEPLVDIFPNVKKPMFQMLEEDARFEAKDAAKVLHRKPYSELEQEAIALEEAKFANKKLGTDKATPKAAKRQFVIVDTSA